MKKLLIIPLLIGTLFLAGCDPKDQCLDAGGSYNEAPQICEQAPQICEQAPQICEQAPQGLIYSNLVDQASQEEVKSALLSAGI